MANVYKTLTIELKPWAKKVTQNIEYMPCMCAFLGLIPRTSRMSNSARIIPGTYFPEMLGLSTTGSSLTLSLQKSILSLPIMLER